jgi:ABC-type antimicrobial peptide transport system permease subunit
LLTEFEREKIKYKNLSKIGITTDEIERSVSKELGVLFFLPYILGILFSMFYSYSLFSGITYINYLTSIGYPFILGLLYLGLQLVYYVLYKKIYIKKIIAYVL